MAKYLKVLINEDKIYQYLGVRELKLLLYYLVIKIFKSYYKSGIIILGLQHNVSPFIVVVMYNYRIAYFVEVFYIKSTRTMR